MSNTGIVLEVIGEEVEESSRIEGYVEETVPLYFAVDFRSHFRMTRSTVEKLCETLGPLLTKERRLTVEKKVLATVWLLANKESYRSVADRFGVSKGTLHLTVMTVCTALSNVTKDHIHFPTGSELRVISEAFKKRCGFPGVVGAIDGTHIPIPAPKSEHRGSYFNRHGQSSIVLQVVVDHTMKFRDICTGWPGSVHDARVVRNSHVSGYVEELPHEFHLLGDSAYPLSVHVMTPFTDDGHLDDIKKRFNKAQASTRVDVERAIGLLKGKFRRMKCLDMLLEEQTPTVIAACCVLHNLILECEGESEDDELMTEVGRPSGDAVTQRSATERQLGQMKRMEIALSL